MGMESQRQLDRFCFQYLQVQLDIDYPTEGNLRSSTFQQSIFRRLFAEHAVKHAPPPRFQLRVLKELMKRIEQSINDFEEEDIDDDLMEAFASLLVLSIPPQYDSVQQKSYVTYALSSLSIQNGNLPTTTLLEARNLVAASGTTGLRTWEAALHLGNYLCANEDLIKGKSILELGAGTGYISILCSKHLRAGHVLATDGSDDVVSSLSTNFYLNGLQDSSKIEGKELKWGWALTAGEHSEWNAGRKIDLVIGADLTYDISVIPALVGTFDELCTLHPEAKVLYAGTVRNPKTFDLFLDACRRTNFVVEEIEFPMIKADKQTGPFYSDMVPIQLCMISRCSKATGTFTLVQPSI